MATRAANGISVVDVDILGDDRFDAVADTVGGLAFRDPNRLKQVVDVAGPDLRDRQLSDRRVGVSFQRGGRLVVVLGAPRRPVRNRADARETFVCQPILI